MESVPGFEKDTSHHEHFCHNREDYELGLRVCRKVEQWNNFLPSMNTGVERVAALFHQFVSNLN